MLNFIKSLLPSYRWNMRSGYKDTLRICLPLMASSLSGAAMLFVDRLFLSHHSLDSIAAAMPAGIARLTMSSLFIGLVSYVSVFAAQYYGAKNINRAASSLWQGIYLSLFIGILSSIVLYILAPAIFSMGGHSPQIQLLEISYFRVLSVAAVFELLFVTFASFLAGIGRTKIVMLVSLSGVIINIPLDYFMIFGLKIGSTQIIPEWGVFGAALATAISWLYEGCIFAFIIFGTKFRNKINVFANYKLDLNLILRITKYGFPGGMQFFLEVATVTYFTLAVGRLGDLELASNSIVFSIESMVFFPLLGLGNAISIMVGQSIGNNNPQDGAEAAKSGIALGTVYTCTLAAAFLLIPGPILNIFIDKSLPPDIQASIIHTGTILLKFIVIYAAFDAFYLCCFGAIKGAGDVMFPMIAMAFWGIVAVIIPVSLILYYGVGTIYRLWACFVFYVVSLMFTGAYRYMSGKWKNMRVIEAQNQVVS